MSDNSLKKGRFTKFSNRIGLFSNQTGNYIANTPEVVLNFPFKDTVLEAGMNKEDVGRDERFLHLEIDKRDIDTLEEPKVLTNFKYIDQNGEVALTADSDIEFFDENGELKQNLLIKGNNLLALHSLKTRLSGRIKLIYIDPPYNTGSDGFKYNDSFNHSSWLTFMRNRLEIAKTLVSKDGFFLIHCDDNEQGYLKVLADEVLGRENFMSLLTIETGEVFGTKAAHIGRTFVKVKDYILVYAKNKSDATTVKPLWTKTNEVFDTHFSNYIKDGKKETLIEHLKKQEWIRKSFEKYSLAISLSNLSTVMTFDDEVKEYIFSEASNIYQDQPYTQALSDDIEEKLKNNAIVEYNGILIFKTSSGSKRYYAPFSNTLKEVDDYQREYTRATARGDLWKGYHYDMRNIETEGGVQFKSGKKPERLLRDIIYSLTDEDDIVLDYHLGSGTTCAVSHKMKRRWIGIEQMDYIETLAKKRLINVVNGDQTGISKITDWKGGGSFVYMELKKYNQTFLDKLMEVTSISDVEEVYSDMQKNAFLKFFFDKKEFEKDENFRSKTWEQRRNMLVDILDENQLYLNLLDMRDAKYKVSNDEMALTERFYGVQEDAEN